MVASLVIHLGYYIALAGAYKHGDLGLTYPVMRGCAPLLVAMGSLAFIGEAHLGGRPGPAWPMMCVGVRHAGALALGPAQRR